MKILLYIISLCLVSVFAVLLFLYFEYRTGAALMAKSVAKLEVVDGSYKLKIHESEKEMLKSFLREIARKVYYEATVYNPPGDIVPDDIDDTVIKEFKERIE